MKPPQVTHEAVYECHDRSTSESRLLLLLQDGRSIVRVNAVLALAARVPADESAVVAALVKIASKSQGDDHTIIGTLTEPMLAAYALHAINTSRCHLAIKQVEAHFTPLQCEDLYWHIKHNPVDRVGSAGHP